MSYLEKPLTRRELIGTAIVATGSLASASTAAGVDLYQKTTQIHLRPHEIPDFRNLHLPQENELLSFENDRSPDHVFRAATVGFGNPDQAYGRGSVVDLNGKFHAYTVEHVADAMKRYGSLVMIPGVGATQIQPERILVLDSNSKNDSPAFYILGEKMQERIALAAKEGSIFPLKLNYDLPRKNEHVVIPSTDTNSYSHYRFTGFSKNENFIQLKGLNSTAENCAGDSGSPVLRIFKDKSGTEFLTGEIYGVLTGSSWLYPTDKGKECATVFVATTNSKA